MAVAPVIRDVVLTAGETLRLRAPTSDDADALIAFFSGLSEHSRYLRFQGLPIVGSALVDPILDPDWVERGSLAGTLLVDGAEEVVAVASWARLRDPVVAEVAFAVADALQGKGIGTRLVEQLAELAAEAGIERFVAEVLRENVAMLSVFADAGFDVSRDIDRGTVEVDFAIAPTE